MGFVDKVKGMLGGHVGKGQDAARDAIRKMGDEGGAPPR